MIKFKTLKYKHYRKAQEILREIEAGQATDEDADRYVMELVESWDYVDVETGQAIPVGRIEDLSLEQYGECMAAFNAEMEKTNVPKGSASPSPSGSTR